MLWFRSLWIREYWPLPGKTISAIFLMIDVHWLSIGAVSTLLAELRGRGAILRSLLTI